ncbi:GumC family protein [Ferrimonas marina]|nr:polysaccharide biosynthesis tyrosine autokinase [Ferrimonas marina]
MEWIGLSARWAVLMRYRWWIVAFTVLVTLVGYAVISRLPPGYYAEASLLLENRQNQVVSIEEIYGVDSTTAEYYQTQYQILQSRKVAEEVVDRTGLMMVPEFTADSGLGLGMMRTWLRNQMPWSEPARQLTEEEKRYRTRQRVLGRYFERLTIIPVRSTQLVKIQFLSEDPQLAAAVANAIGRVYIESYMEDKLVATQEATGWMRGRLETLKDNLRVSELQLQQFREEAGLVDVEGLLSLEGKQLGDIQARLTEAKSRRSAAESVARSVAGVAGGNIDQLASLPAINRHPSIQQLRRAESQAEQKVAQLANRYGPKHKAMIGARAELVEIRASLRRQIRQLVDGIEQEYQAASREESSLLAELATAKQNYQGLSKNESEYRELLREVETNRQLYDTFLTRIKETGVAGDFNEAIARFTDPALPPLVPAEPKKPLLLIAVFSIALALASLGALLYARLVDVVSRADEVEYELKAKLLGIVPEVRRPSSDLATTGYFDTERPEFGESWRSIRTALSLQGNNRRPMTLAVSSATPEEGKTTSAISLALSLQQVKKVLLVDCDLRRPSVGKAFKIPEYEPGLTNAVNGTHSLEQCIYHDAETGLDILSAGTALSSPLETLSGEPFEQLIDKVRNMYDVVVMDTPPVNAVSDSLMVGRLAGSMVFVVRADYTRVKLAKRALEQVLENRILLAGVVLNRVNKDAMQAQYGSGYDSYYGHGYRQQISTTEKCESAA